jgi:2-hydroxycyclohexanecarboxyl-CoA dehydrogenase
MHDRPGPGPNPTHPAGCTPMPLPPQGPQRVVIVGGTAGIGLACAHRLATTGTRAIALVGRSAERGAMAQAALRAAHPGLDVRFLRGDGAEAPQAMAAVQEATGHFGGLDALVSCAGGDVMPRLLAKVATHEVMPMLEQVAACVILPARAAYEVMRAQGAGAIVCVASDAGKIATPGESVIGAAMAAIAMFCRGMAIEAKRDGVRVNCVTPSIVQGTPLYDRLQQDAFSQRLFAKAEALAGLGVATAEDVAELIAFLVGPASARITGQTVSVTGGISAA